MDDLLADILAHPDDDGPRLVYADALQSAGDPRGELITVQCELARLGWDSERIFLEWLGEERVDAEALDDGRFAKLRRREAELVRDHGKRWWSGKPKVDARMFRRGFVEHLTIEPSQTLEALIALAPMLRSIWTGATRRHILEAFFGSEQLRRIRELTVNPIAIGWLAEGKNLGALRHLTLQCPGGAHALAMLGGAPFLPALETFILYSFSLDADAIATLFGRAAALRELQIVDSRMGPEAAGVLLGSAAIANVRVLALRHARLLAGQLAPLLAGKRRWGSLAALDLRTNKLAAADTAAIADLPALRVLDLGNNPLGAPGLEALVSPARRGLGALRSLALQKSGVDDHAVKTLARSALMPRLRVLDLRSNAVTDAGARALVAGGAAQHLRVLYLGGNKLSAAGKKLVKAALPTTRLFV